MSSKVEPSAIGADSELEPEAKSVMVSPVETVKSTDRLAYAMKKLVKKNIGCLVVVEHKKPVGIITERDITRKVVETTKVLTAQVKRVMSCPLITVTPNTPVPKVLYLMLKYGIRRLPVIEKEELVGLVSERDLVRWVLRISYEPKIPVEIKQILARRSEAKT
jgi:CBS domain-containing protein